MHTVEPLVCCPIRSLIFNFIHTSTEADSSVLHTGSESIDVPVVKPFPALEALQCWEQLHCSCVT